MDRINALQAWIMSIVARQYKDIYYNLDDLLRVWYKNFKERVKLSVMKEHKAIWEKYN